MRKLLFLTSALLLLCILDGIVQPAMAQTDDGTLYVQVDYMKVPEGGEDAYLALERDMWKPIHEQQVRQGIITGWSVYSVRFGAPNADYNFTTVNVFDDFAKLENPYPQEVFEAAFSDGTPEGLTERTVAAREMVHTEIWQLIDTAQAEGEPGPSGRYLVLNYMHVPTGGESKYVSVEQEVWKPLHQARVDAGQMSGWGMYGLAFPGGKVTHYSFGTVDYYDELGDLMGPGPLGPEILQAAHPNATEDAVEQMMDRTNQARTIYKSELWQLIDSTGGSDE
jgi:hypothetical protein